MTVAQTTGPMSPGLLKVAERAKREPNAKFNSLAHLIDEVALTRAYERLRKDAAAGVDGVTVKAYGEMLAANIRSLHERMKAGRYRHQPIRRVQIPKENGTTRPIGISTVEDKIVQGALREVMEAIYEQDFLVCSYGFRPGRSAHDAVRDLNGILTRGDANWLLETDITSFFDSIDREKLHAILRERIVDGALLRLVGKCIAVGVLDGEEWSEPEKGTAQGSILSPLLGNIYLHTVLDVWFEREVRPRLRGRATLIRYADDLVITFEHCDDAERVHAVLPRRLGKFGLTMHPDKTRLIRVQRPPRGGTSRGETFDFLGFTFCWARTRWGNWQPRLRTRRSRLRRSLSTVAAWCRRHRHDAVSEQRDALNRRLVGHYNYYGVNGNLASLAVFKHSVERTWFKWLRRRGNRRKLSWPRFKTMVKSLPLSEPTIRVQIWPRPASH